MYQLKLQLTFTNLFRSIFVKAFLAIIVLLACASATFAEEPRWYIGGNVSMWSDTSTHVNSDQFDLDMSTGYGFVIGMDNDDWRWGVEFGAMDADASLTLIPEIVESLDITTIMFSVTKSWDLNVKDLDFYLGGGIGMYDIEDRVGDAADGLTGVIRAGLEYSMGNGRLGFGYKHQFFDGDDLGGGLELDGFNAGALEISYRLLF